ncbi:hypothetical protein RVR_6392 [Actinacidiphila reveromycinica]|uniref:Uncharacterized protein n=1 Tax=Actinacidiphila reveromycinica TaxID=659352 RepID=A0A7U3VQC0_9ACTN|nr:hypothetical protein RVR_6392 [Streptomyces sp. SN-593]
MPGASCGGPRWLTGDAAEALLSGRQVPLADGREEGEARRLARLLRAAAAEQAALRSLDPAREEEALAAFRAARVVEPGAAVGAGGGSAGGAGGAAGSAVGVGAGAGDEAGVADTLPEPVMVGGRAAASPRSARLLVVRRTRSGRSARMVLAAAASVVALGGVAVGVAATAEGTGGREPARPAGSSSVPAPLASEGSASAGAGATGRRAVIPGKTPRPTSTGAAPPAYGTTSPPGGDQPAPAAPGHADNGHGNGAANRLNHGRHLGWGRGHTPSH